MTDTDDSLEFFQTFSGRIIAFWGARGDNGLLVYEGDRGWITHSSGSLIWDQFHQEVYRNFRADSLSIDELKQRDIPLPAVDVNSIPQPLAWENNFQWEMSVSEVPAPIIQVVKARMPQKTEVYLVLLEDRYETSFGDGKYLYPEAAFWNEPQAKEYVLQYKTSEPDPAKREWYEYTIKAVLLWLDGEKLHSSSDIQLFERYSLPVVVKLLEDAS